MFITVIVLAVSEWVAILLWYIVPRALVPGLAERHWITVLHTLTSSRSSARARTSLFCLCLGSSLLHVSYIPTFTPLSKCAHVHAHNTHTYTPGPWHVRGNLIPAICMLTRTYWLIFASPTSQRMGMISTLSFLVFRLLPSDLRIKARSFLLCTSEAMVFPSCPRPDPLPTQALEMNLVLHTSAWALSGRAGPSCRLHVPPNPRQRTSY